MNLQTKRIIMLERLLLYLTYHPPIEYVSPSGYKLLKVKSCPQCQCEPPHVQRHRLLA